MDEMDKKGAFIRTESTFRNKVEKGSAQYPPESGRYHLYVSYACPWAHRTLVYRALKGLEDCIGISVVHPIMWPTKPGVDTHFGWHFKSEAEFKGNIPDTNENCKTVRELYEKTNTSSQKFTVPILWDKKTRTIVNNESSEIIRMFNDEFNDFAKNPNLNLRPCELESKIDKVNDWVYPLINNGVYKAGFAQSQEAYDTAVKGVFEGLENAEEILSKQQYLAGELLTEADIRLWVTLVRFDEVYVGHFKCNKARIADYPNLVNYVKAIYQLPGMHVCSVCMSVSSFSVRNAMYCAALKFMYVAQNFNVCMQVCRPLRTWTTLFITITEATPL